MDAPRAIGRYGGVQPVPSHAPEPLRARHPWKGRRVHGISNTDAASWTEPQWYVYVSPLRPVTLLTADFWSHFYIDLNLYVGQLTQRQKSDPAVRHALGVQRAVAMGNYHALFDLYMNAPNMGAYIMDHFIDRERIRALMVMTKA